MLVGLFILQFFYISVQLYCIIHIIKLGYVYNHGCVLLFFIKCCKQRRDH